MLRGMGMTRFQKLATGALVSVLALIFVGATVRVTGAGMGCPDWPKCWGRLIPPTSVEEVDFDKLPIDKFREKARRMGHANPDGISEASLREEFNPRHVWTEFFNRMSSMPVAFFTLATFVAGFWQRAERPLVFWMGFFSVILVGANAVMGAWVVQSGLRPGVLTAHLALAMLLIGVLAYCAWRGTDRPWRVEMAQGMTGLRWAVGLLLVSVVAEGIVGSQIREITDQMAKSHAGQPRSEWIGELEQTGGYLFHRSFSWAVMILACWAYWASALHRSGGAGKVEKVVLGIVVAQMVLGLVMSQVHIYAWVQVLHVGLAAVLLAFVCLWWLGLVRPSAGGS